MLFVVQEEKISASKKKRRLKEETWKKSRRAEGNSLMRMQDSFRFSFVHFYYLIVTGTAEYMLHGSFLIVRAMISRPTIADNDSIY
jgi:hypothetical protein